MFPLLWINGAYFWCKVLLIVLRCEIRPALENYLDFLFMIYKYIPDWTSELVFMFLIYSISFSRLSSNKDFFIIFFIDDLALSDLFSCEIFLYVRFPWRDDLFWSVLSLFALTRRMMSSLFVAPSFWAYDLLNYILDLINYLSLYFLF